MTDPKRPHDETTTAIADAPMTRRGFLVATTVTVGGALATAACGDDRRTSNDVVDDVPDVSPVPGDVTSGDDALPGGDVHPDTTPADDVRLDVSETVAPPTFDPTSLSLAPEDLFPLGVQSGDPVATGIMLQCRYTGAGPLEVIVFAAGPDVTPGAELARIPCEVGDGGFVHVDVQSLQPGLAARFVFAAPEGRSGLGRFRTAPHGDVERVTFGATSCASHTYRPFDVLKVAAADSLDFFLLLGDTVYADDATTRAEYRSLWARNLQSLEYQALLASHPLIATWDDHEVDNNWDPETIDGARLEAARGAFFEHLALRRHPEAPERIYRSLRFGDLVELFVLDCRSERRPSTRDKVTAEYISEAQRAWLVEGLAASDATFKVIANSIPITRWPGLYPGDSQRWEGYAAQRDAVIAATNDIEGVVWVAGDFHFGAVTRVDPVGGPGHGMTEVLVGPVAHINPGLSIVELTGSAEQFLFTTASRNYGRFTAERQGGVARLTVQHIDPEGTEIARHLLLEVK